MGSASDVLRLAKSICFLLSFVFFSRGIINVNKIMNHLISAFIKAIRQPDVSSFIDPTIPLIPTFSLKKIVLKNKNIEEGNRRQFDFS